MADQTTDITFDDIKAREPGKAYVRAFGKNCLVVELSPRERDELDGVIQAYREKNGEEALTKIVTVLWVSRCLRNQAGQRVIPDDAVESLADQGGGRDFRRAFKALAPLNFLDDGEDVAEDP